MTLKKLSEGTPMQIITHPSTNTIKCLLEAKIYNLEKLIKQLADNVSILPKNLDKDKGQNSPQKADSQGPSKCTRAHSKKTDTRVKDEVKTVVDNMHILADQALDLIKTT